MNKIILAFIYYCENYAATFVSKKLLYLRFFVLILHYYAEGVGNFITSCVFYTYYCIYLFKKYKKKGLSIRKVQNV